MQARFRYRISILKEINKLNEDKFGLSSFFLYKHLKPKGSVPSVTRLFAKSSVSF